MLNIILILIFFTYSNLLFAEPILVNKPLLLGKSSATNTHLFDLASDTHKTHTGLTEIELSLRTFIKKHDLSQHYSEESIKYSLASMDSRLKLKPCETTIDVKPTHSNWLRKSSSFKFICTQPRWAITLPVKFHLYKKIWFSKRHISQNQPVSKSDIYIKETDILTSPYDIFHADQTIEGMIAKRSISLNTPIFTHSLKRPKTIKRNEKVDILAISPSFQVRSKGIALEDGFIGEPIKVKNSSSKRVVEARVKSRGVVEINL